MFIICEAWDIPLLIASARWYEHSGRPPYEERVHVGLHVGGHIGISFFE